MSRFLIIDTEKTGRGNTNGFLTEEETLAKFKEIWEDGGENAKYCCEGEGGYSYEHSEANWKKFKETL